MIQKPIVLDSKLVYDGWLKLRLDKLKFPDKEETYDHAVVKIGEGVAILPFIDEDTVLLARQYRHPLKEELLELIQGGIKKEETKETAAKREMLEETGFSGHIEYLLTMYPLPGSLEMQLHILKATNLKKIQEPNLDLFEYMELVQMPFNNVYDEILLNKHKDSALISAILYHKHTLGR